MGEQPMQVLEELRGALGAAHVLTGEDAAAWGHDATQKYRWTPLAVLRPGSTAEVSAALRIAHAARVPVVPVGGNTGLTGATRAEGQLMLCLDRMNRIREIRPAARTAVVEAGTVVARLQEAAAEHDLYFPLWFGARGSATIGGTLSTNAGGSNVLRYGNTRALCLGVEVVLADGRILDLMSALLKDNSGYDLKDLFIGAEGTLGIVTAAVVKLVPQPAAHATAMIAAPALPAALELLNRLQAASGGLVEAFEFMPPDYWQRYAVVHPEVPPPFSPVPPVTILAELGATAPRDTTPAADGSLPLATLLEDVLADLLDKGLILDARVAQSEAQRRAFWTLRENAAEITFGRQPLVDTDIAVPLERVEDFLTRIAPRLATLDPAAEVITVGHLGDGNLHYTVWPSQPGATLQDAIREAVEDVVAELGGSFSAEHGVGTSKLPSMTRRKDPVALEVMRSLKAALDPLGLLNPGKTVPAPGAATPSDERTQP